MASAREWKALTLFVLCVAVIAAPAQTYTTLVTDIPNYYPAPLVQGFDGSLYGTTSDTIFKVTRDGTLSTVHKFSVNAFGQAPSGLALGMNGQLYGTASSWGTPSPTCPAEFEGCGTVFSFTSAGSIFLLHSFSGTDGMFPMGGLTLGSDGNFYGTTYGSTKPGASGPVYGNIFKISPNSGYEFTVLHTFSYADGAYPIAPLVLGRNGNLYGTTPQGGTYDAGTVFMITTGGTFTSLYSFGNPRTGAASPRGALVQAADGNFYGTTPGGGQVCDIDQTSLGTIFLIGPSGNTEQTLYDFFNDCTHGSSPDTGLLLGEDGNFYGGASGIVSNDDFANAILFEITPKGVLTTLYDFGYSTYPTLMQATNGTFYGATTGSFPYAGQVPTVFSLSTGLGPFITTIPPSRGIGAKVFILGQGFTGTTSVTFNGVSAEFTVNSDTQITTFVPAGAKTGHVQVTTPTGTLSTKVVFVVP